MLWLSTDKISVLEFSSCEAESEQDSVWTYLPHLDMGVFYRVGVTFDQLFHLPQVSLLDILKLLLTHIHTPWRTRSQSHSTATKTSCYYVTTQKLLIINFINSLHLTNDVFQQDSENQNRKVHIYPDKVNWGFRNSFTEAVRLHNGIWAARLLN